MAKKTVAPDEDFTRHLERLAARFKELRKAQGHGNYEVFANKVNMNRSQVGRYETGKDDLQFSSLLKMIKSLGMTPKEFFAYFDSWD